MELRSRFHHLLMLSTHCLSPPASCRLEIDIASINLLLPFPLILIILCHPPCRLYLNKPQCREHLLGVLTKCVREFVALDRQLLIPPISLRPFAPHP